MTLKASLFQELRDDATVSALVGTRIYPDRADQNAVMPYITYIEIFNQGVHHLGGVKFLDLATYQFSLWAADSVTRTELEDAVRTLFDGEARLFGTTIITDVTRTENTSKQDTTEDPDDGSQNIVYGKFMDFDFWHIR